MNFYNVFVEIKISQFPVCEKVILSRASPYRKKNCALGWELPALS